MRLRASTFRSRAPRSLLSGEPMKVSWSANWDDDLGGSPEIVPGDPVLAQVSAKVKYELEQTFMFYLPRICEHCLNPACAASCPSGAIYKRAEDGIVLVDQDRCRGWRMCVSGCPYKKVYFNHKTGKAEKCTFCYPRVEVGLPTVCAETCVGRLRYIGLMLYDADAVLAAASVERDEDLYPAQLDVLLDPRDPEVIEGARRGGISQEWIDAAQRSPVYALIKDYRVALPLHPEYRTVPMVWYVPPLSPVVDAVSRDGHDGEELGNLFGALEALRIPMEYLAGLFTAGDTAVIEAVLRRLAAMRSYMRDINLGREPQPDIPAAVGMSEKSIYEMYRLLAIAKYDERYVIPTAYADRGAPARGDRHRLPARFRRRARHVHLGALRGGQRRAGAGRGGELPGTAGTSAHRGDIGDRDPAVAGEPAELGRQGQPRRTERRCARDEAAGQAAAPRARRRPPGVAGGVAAARLSRRGLRGATRRGRGAALAAAGWWPPTRCGDARTRLRADAGPAAATRYVDTFDLRKRTTLYLTYWTAGDTRNRGREMLRFVEAYRAAGVSPPEDESPDHLAVVLEFAATVDARAGAALLAEHAVAIRMLTESLTDTGSPYARCAHRGVRDATAGDRRRRGTCAATRAGGSARGECRVGAVHADGAAAPDDRRLERRRLERWR